MKIKKVVFTSQARVTALRPYIDQVLQVLGHPEAWVSDLSSIGDFGETHWSGKRKLEWLEGISQQLGFSVSWGDLLVDIAQRLKEH